MSTREFESSLLRQAEKTSGCLCNALENLQQQVEEKLSMKELFDLQSIIISGCGDSWMAAIAVKDAFEKLTKVETRAMRAIDFSRHLSSKKLGFSPNTPLVILISYSGAATRMIECAKRARKYGANTVAITVNLESQLAQECANVVSPILPKDGEFYPGCLTYSAAILALFQIALRIGRVRGVLGSAFFFKTQKDLKAYCISYNSVLDNLCQKALVMAYRWKDLYAYEFIGDGSDKATACFGAAKVVETFGGYTSCQDSEEWCHVDCFFNNPRSIGRVVIVNAKSPSFSRLCETVKQIARVESPILVITDSQTDYGECIEVINVPQAPQIWMSPMLEHLPFDIIAGYMGEMKGEPSFRAGDSGFDTYEARDCVKNGTKIVII